MSDQVSRPLSNAERLARAVLLFHSGGYWDSDKQAKWIAVLGKVVPTTTKELCDLAREILAEEQRP
jgi:hypothetical protein